MIEKGKMVALGRQASILEGKMVGFWEQDVGPPISIQETCTARY